VPREVAVNDLKKLSIRKVRKSIVKDGKPNKKVPLKFHPGHQCRDVLFADINSQHDCAVEDFFWNEQKIYLA
jgi:hypothetical protein